MSAELARTRKRKVRFAKRVVRTDGERLRYLEAGQGNPVIILQDGDGLTSSPLSVTLAKQCRVIICGLPSAEGKAPRDVARQLAQAVTTLGLDRYVLISTAATTSPALWQAIETQEQVEALVLVSPALQSDAELTSRMKDILAPTLVLVGTNDTSLPPDVGQQYVERISNCYFTMVYDAGRDIETERPEALTATVCDFVERRGGFIVERQTMALNP